MHAWETTIDIAKKKLERSIDGSNRFLTLHANNESNIFYCTAVYDKISQILFYIQVYRPRFELIFHVRSIMSTSYEGLLYFYRNFKTLLLTNTKVLSMSRAYILLELNCRFAVKTNPQFSYIKKQNTACPFCCLRSTWNIYGCYSGVLVLPARWTISYSWFPWISGHLACPWLNFCANGLSFNNILCVW